MTIAAELQPQAPAANARKASAIRCARCHRELTRPGTRVPGLGVVGPECEAHVMQRLSHLTRQGLGVLVLQGEQRMPALRLLDGTYALPHDAISVLTTIAARVGVSLSVRFDPATKDVVVSVAPTSLKAFVKRSGEEVQA